MRKIIVGLALFIGLVFGEEFAYTQDQIKIRDEKCKNGDNGACITLGYAYIYGYYGLKEDYKKAKTYFEKVCKKGNEKDEYFAFACINLGEIYNDGLGVRQNYKKALELYTLACDKGDATACRNIGAMYYEGKGVSKDTTKGMGYYERVCNAGDWLGCIIFATYHHENGNHNKATPYYKKACKLGRDVLDVQNNPKYKEFWQQVCDRYDP